MNKIIKKYEETFFSDLTEKDKKEIYFNQFMWHAFSYKKIECLDGEDAINEFAKMNKNEVYIFLENDDTILEEKNVTLEKLFEIVKNHEEFGDDYYVVSKDFTWTFVTTHETYYNDGIYHYLGPFFKKVNK